MPPTPTKLGSKLAVGASNALPASPVTTPLRRQVTAGRRGEEVVLPILGRVFLELPGTRAFLEIEAAVAREMRRLEVGDLSILTAAKYETEQALRVLAEAARDPDDRAKAFGTLEEWGDLDTDVVNIAWQAYGDVRERLDPVSMELTHDEMIAIAAAVKKKDVPLLRTFGVVRLSSWLATTDALQWISPPPNSPSSDSPSEKTAES